MGRKPELPALTGFIFAGDSQTIDLNCEWDKWLQWLQETKSFRYVPESSHPGFTLRCEKDNKGYQSYWYAYRKESGKLRRCYVGKSQDLNPKKLEAIAVKLSSKPKGKRTKIVTEKDSLTNKLKEENTQLLKRLAQLQEVTESQAVTIEKLREELANAAEKVKSLEDQLDSIIARLTKETVDEIYKELQNTLIY